MTYKVLSFLTQGLDRMAAFGLLAVVVLLWMSTASGAGDEDVLLALKQGIQGGNGALESWIPGTGFCNWTGIQCDSVQKDRVQSISLPNSNVQGSLTPLLGRLQYLAVLNFDLNNLTGIIPTSLENCSRLTNISLGSNQLTGIIPQNLDRCQGLQRLDLWNNQLQGIIPPSLGNCTMMNYLSLGQNNLSGSIPQELGKLGNLQILRLFTNNLVGDFPKFLTNCTRLQIISIRNNSLTGYLPPELQQLVQLLQLRIQSNFFEGVIPPEIGNMTTLYYMDISSNKLSGEIPQSFGKLVNIQEMYLNNNSLSGRIPAALARCRSLGTLDLSHNLLGGPLPDSIGEFQSLTNLTLDHNLISGQIPDSMGRLYKLINLDISYNRLEGNLPAALAGLSSIQVAFNLAYNSLSGRIPAWIGNFKTIQNISLQYNKFSGDIPTALTQCVGLNLLNLAGNELTGEIPADIGHLESLVKLDFSSNQLRGPIPSSLKSLSNLVSLNLSMNQLEGPVPDDQRFKAASFQGNPGLCGSILNRRCPSAGTRKKSSKEALLAGVIAAAALIAVVALVACWCIWYRRQKRIIVSSKRETEKLDSGSFVGPLISYSPQELVEMTEDYSDHNLIGTGAFSTVYRGTASKEELVAVKLLRLDMKEEVRKSFFAEINTLGRVRHRNLVRLIGYCWTWETKALVLEYMANGSLQQHLKLLDWPKRFNIAVGVAEGLAYLHHGFDSPIVHRDLKPGNVLLDSEFEAHVADFGISRIAHLDEVTVSAFKGSIGYAPPEYATSNTVSTKGDVYSFGVLLLEMMTGMSPTSEALQDESSSLQDWVKTNMRLSFEGVIDAKLRSDMGAYASDMKSVLRLALMCTASFPASRPQMQQVLNNLLDIRKGDLVKGLPSVEALVKSPSPYGQRPIW